MSLDLARKKEVDYYKFAPDWTSHSNTDQSKSVLLNATQLHSFKLNIPHEFPNELAALIFNALETKSHLTCLSIVGNVPADSTDGQPGFADYFCNFLLARGNQLQKIKFRSTMMKIEVVQHLVDIAADSMTSLRILALNGMASTNYSSSLSPPILKLYSAWISKSNLTELRIMDSLLSSNDISILADGLSQNTSLTKLDLSKNLVGDTGVLALATALESSSSLTWLNLSSNKIGDDGALSLTFLLKKNKALKRLDLTGNLITPAGVRHLALALKSNKGLAELFLDSPHKHIDKGATALSSLVKWCQFNSSLKRLVLNNFQVDNSVALLDLIEKNTSISALELERMKTINLSALAKVLRNNKTLLSLNLTGFEADEHAPDDNTHEEFLQALGQSNLTRVNLSHTRLHDKGCEILAAALMHNTRLQALNLACNKISSRGTSALAQCLAVNKTLLELDLSGNSTQSDEFFTVLLDQNQTLTALHLREADINANGCKILAKIIASRPNLHELDIRGNYQVHVNFNNVPLVVAMQQNGSIVKLLGLDNSPEELNLLVHAAPQLMRVIPKSNVNMHQLPQSSIQRTWLARNRFKAQISALRAAQVVLLAPDRGDLKCLPTEILELIFGAVAGHASMANDFLVTFAKQRERLKYERELANKVDFLRGYLQYLHSTRNR